MFAAGDPADLWRFRPHPEVWLLVAGLAFLWWYAIKRVGPKATLPGEVVVTRAQVAWGAAALLTLWAASDWPIHDIGEQYLYSVHMFQHILFQFAVAPMVLLATPTWLARMLVGSGRGYRAVKWLTRIVPATIIFNVVVVGSHIPWVVNQAVVNAPLHYGVHVLVVVSALIMWMPVCGPLPELRLPLPLQAVHLILQTVVPTVPAGWLTMADGVVSCAVQSVSLTAGIRSDRPPLVSRIQQAIGLRRPLAAGRVLRQRSRRRLPVLHDRVADVPLRLDLVVTGEERGVAVHGVHDEALVRLRRL